MEFRNFKRSDVDHDSDSQYFERRMSGRMTKERWRIVKRFVRIIDSSEHRCGCEHDCCGHVCGMCAKASYKHNQLTVSIKVNFNV